MLKTICIVLARGGSKGIPLKNIVEFCGKPLIAWTLEQCLSVKEIDSIWVSSDNEEILNIASSYDVHPILRPGKLSGDTATSESGWLHATEIIENEIGIFDLVLAPQVTSPLRESIDIARGISDFEEQRCDSMFSCSASDDLFLWEKTPDGVLKSVNYNFKDRKRRQDFPKQYIENGSFYLFKPDTLRKYNNRFGVKIGMTQMEFWKMLEIDSVEDLMMCEVLMRAFLLE